MKSSEYYKETTHLSAFSAAVQAKCPRCRKGNMFSTPMYSFKQQKMHVNCPYCNMKFEKEPGYFYVAMFVSYAFNVLEMIAIAIATYFVVGNLDNPYLYMATLFSGILILAPFNYRYSRVVLLYWLTPGLHYIRDIGRKKPVEQDKDRRTL